MPINLQESDSEDELPPGWEEKVTQDGSVYFVNHSSKTTQWTHPRTGRKKMVSGELPYGWERREGEDGRVVFMDVENGRQTYTDPRLAFAVEEKLHTNDIRQRFDSSSTALQVLHGRDLTGKVAIVTGANTGIGYETVRSLVRHGCRVLLAGRSMDSLERAIHSIGEERRKAGELCSPLLLDLASLRSVKECADRCKQMFTKIDMLILNAGVFGLPYSLTEDNYETTFQVNHLSHLYLALLLEPLLGVGSRVIFVSSESHRFANFSAPTSTLSSASLSPPPDRFGSMMAYNNSKLCNVLCARALAGRWSHRNVCVTSLHPGNMVSTGLSRNWWFYRLIFAVVRPFTKSLQQAASTTVYCATAKELEGTTGLYFNNCYPCDMSVTAQDDDLAIKVFEICVNMIQAKMADSDISSYNSDKL